MPTPFLYPAGPHERRHGPRGYRDREGFRPWLRDEFSFRCVYCLRREQWDQAIALHIDHYVPTSQATTDDLHYDNMLYACAHCNLAKSSQLTSDPCQFLRGDVVTVLDSGRLSTSDSNAARLIEQLRLNRPEMVHFRQLWLEIIAMARQTNPELYARLLGFPEDLPDLSKLRPPAGNDRPQGMEQSHFARRNRGELPAVY